MLNVPKKLCKCIPSSQYWILSNILLNILLNERWGIRFHDLTINWTRRPPGPTLHYQQSWLGFEPMTLRSSSHCRGCYHSTHPMVLKGFEPTIDPNSTHNCLYSQKIGMDSNLWTYLSVSDLLPQYPYSGSSRDPLKGGPGFEPTSFWQC